MSTRIVSLIGCLGVGLMLLATTASAADNPLAGSSWRLVEIQSMDDAIGTVRPEDPTRFTMQLNEDGSVSMVLDCNRAHGTWTAEPSAEGSSGRFELGPLATTKALCPPPQLDERITSQAPYFRGYLLKDGKLYLSLMADGGIYAWEPNEPEGGAVQEAFHHNRPGAGPGPPSSGAAGIDVRTETVRFDKGTSGTNIEDRVQGYDTVQYLLGASAGQYMIVEMKADNGATYFNVFEPGKTPGNDEAMFIGSVAGSSFEGPLPADGDYMIQVYLMRNAARRDEVASYELEIAIVDSGEPDAKVAGTDFHATGQISCARYEGQPMGQCEFGVKRRRGGDAELTVFWGDGSSRVIYFEDGAPVRSDAGDDLKATMKSDLHLITIGAERFELVEAIVVGG